MSNQLDKIKELTEKRQQARVGGGEKAIEKQPANPKLCTTLSGYFEHTGDFKKAAYYNKLSVQKNK